MVVPVCNTYQKEEGPNGGELNVTVLGFQGFDDDDAAMCAVLLKSVIDKIPSKCFSGMDVIIEHVYVIGETEVHFIKRNSGPGKYYPFGSTCQFHGKAAPCFVLPHNFSQTC
jgi:hypothetical protein